MCDETKKLLERIDNEPEKHTELELKLANLLKIALSRVEQAEETMARLKLLGYQA